MFTDAGDELLKVNDQHLMSLNHDEAVDIFHNLQNGPIRLTFRRTGLHRQVETRGKENTSNPLPSLFLHNRPTPTTSSPSCSPGTYYSLISPPKFKSSNESNNSTGTSLSLSRSDACWKKLKDSLRMYGRKCPRIKANSFGQDSDKSFLTRNGYQSLLPTQVEKPEDRGHGLPLDDSNAMNDGQNINYTMKVIFFSLKKACLR